MQFLKWAIVGVVGMASVCHAQVSTTKIEGLLTSDRKDFVRSLSEKLAKDDETTILRAHLLRKFICQVTSDSAKQFCKEINGSEDLAGQNTELIYFALNSKNLRIVLEALNAMIRAAQSNPVSKEAKDQVNNLAPKLGQAMALSSTDPIKAAANILGELKERSAVRRAFNENEALKVYEPLLIDVLYWLERHDPDGRAEPWEIAGARAIDTEQFGCRVRKSGKFQCWRNVGGKRIEFPMENEDGYRLSVLPNGNIGAMQFCSESIVPGNPIKCWIGSALANGEYEIEKCTGMRLAGLPGGLYGNFSQWAPKTKFVSLKCEKTGDRLLGYNPYEEKTQMGRATNVATVGKVDQAISVDGPQYQTAFFMNYFCRVWSNVLLCDTMNGAPSNNLHLWIADSKTGVLKDAANKHWFADFPFAGPYFKPDGIVAVKDGICVWQTSNGFRCRHFTIEGENVIAWDYVSDSRGVSSAMDKVTQTTDDDYTPNELDVEYWRLEKAKTNEGVETYLPKKIYFSFNGGLSDNNSILPRDFFIEEKVLCYDSMRRINNQIDYNDPDYDSGANYKCIRLDEKHKLMGNLETAIPIKKSRNARRVGRAMCMSHAGRLLCDFPALSQRLFEKPILSLPLDASIMNPDSGHVCAFESTSAICYSLNEPASFHALPTLRFSYKGISKEFMLGRYPTIRSMGPGNDPWMCTKSHNYNDQSAIHTCETAGPEPKIFQINEFFTDPEPARPARSRARVSEPAVTPTPKRSRGRSRYAGQRGLYTIGGPVMPVIRKSTAKEAAALREMNSRLSRPRGPNEGYFRFPPNTPRF